MHSEVRLKFRDSDEVQLYPMNQGAPSPNHKAEEIPKVSQSSFIPKNHSTRFKDSRETSEQQLYPCNQGIDTPKSSIDTPKSIKDEILENEALTFTNLAYAVEGNTEKTE